jgi:hypothetical protein
VCAFHATGGCALTGAGGRAEGGSGAMSLGAGGRGGETGGGGHRLPSGDDQYNAGSIMGSIRPNYC